MVDEAQVKRAFLEVVEAPVREEALRRVCGERADLRERVQRLLAAHDERDDGPAPAGAPLAWIGPYRVARRLGAGGMGVVYEGEREGQRVAVKVLHPWLLSAEGRRRLDREAALLTLLRHPGIARVYEAGGAPIGGVEVPYLVMELIPAAVTLTVYAERRRLDRRRRVELAGAVCDAVHAAHQSGVIHRDIKPANLLVDEAGRVKVIDFGVGRLRDGAGTMLTQAGQIVGTLNYMSPEQCDGSPPDVRADVYSIGAVLHELVCGRTPHELGGLPLPAALERVRQGPGEMAMAGVPRALRAVLRKALAPRREDRYQSAAELGEDLRRFLGGEAVVARAPGLVARGLRAMARHPVLATVGACAGLAAAAIAGTVAGIYVLAVRPDYLDRPSSGQGVSLMSRAGHRLAHWDAGQDGQVTFWRMVERPPEMGGGRLVLLGFDHRSACYPGELCAFSPGRAQTPEWTSATSPLRPPPPSQSDPEYAQAVDLALTADVLPGVPGDEVVCIQSLHPYSATAVRVLDLAGRVRYEVWHNGGIGSARWLEGARLLVLAGLNSERRWDERGHELHRGHYPVVALALAPVDGHVSRGDWVVRGGRRLDETLRWYRWLGPAERLGPLHDVYATLAPPAGGRDAGRFVLAEFSAADTGGSRGGFVFLLNEEGLVQKRWDDDGYKALRATGSVPPIEAFQVLEYEALPAPRDLPCFP